MLANSIQTDDLPLFSLQRIFLLFKRWCYCFQLIPFFDMAFTPPVIPGSDGCINDTISGVFYFPTIKDGRLRPVFNEGLL